MEDAIEAAIKKMVTNTENSADGAEALKLSQAALNLAHVAQVWRHVKAP